MQTKTIFKTIMIVLFVSLISGCSLNLGSEKKDDSGFFVSSDKGATWAQKSELLNIGGNRSFFKSTQSTFLKVDPNDPKALFLGTTQDGLFYSFNKGVSWQRTLLERKGVVHDVVVDPKYPCTWYIAIGGTLYRTLDCSRHLQTLNLESSRAINAIGIDFSNSNKIYLGLSDGTILKSETAGSEWTAITSLNDSSSIIKIMINAKDPKKIYVITKNKGIYKSDNEGYEWRNISDNIKVTDKNGKEVKVSGAYSYKDLVFDYTKDDALFYANSSGLFYSDNGGNNWVQIKLTSKSTTPIYAIGMNPKNSKEIYYSTSKLFYRSDDFGLTWSSKKISTTKIPINIIVDSENPNNIFVALRALQQ